MAQNFKFKFVTDAVGPSGEVVHAEGEVTTPAAGDPVAAVTQWTRDQGYEPIGKPTVYDTKFAD